MWCDWIVQRKVGEPTVKAPEGCRPSDASRPSPYDPLPFKYGIIRKPTVNGTRRIQRSLLLMNPYFEREGFIRETVGFPYLKFSLLVYRNMGKKCIPGVFCIENMTLFLLFFILVVLLYLYYTTVKQQQQQVPTQPQVIVLGGMNNLPPQNDSLIPVIGANNANAIPNNAIPVNIESRGRPSSYTQVGILTRGSGGDLILPLMGRKLTRDKMQYYTISNTGNMNTKLPISKNGKSCTGEYGCDEVYDGDTVFVEGYADTFKATIYENSRFNYIPYL